MLDWSSDRNSSNSRLEHGHASGEIRHPCALLCSVLSVMSTITGTDDTRLASHTIGLYGLMIATHGRTFKAVLH